MAKVSIIFTRYKNSVDYLYKYENNPNIEFILVDDGSPDTPAMPDFWKIYKITEDIGWNSEGAKNLGMHVMEHDWGLTCDMDHPIFVNQVSRLDVVTDILPKTVGYNPVRIDGKCINSYLCHKDLWWHEDVNGYDETFTGKYGYDKTLTNAINNKSKSCVARLDCIQLDMINPGIPIKRSDKHISRETIDWDMPRTSERLRFPWKRLQ